MKPVVVVDAVVPCRKAADRAVRLSFEPWTCAPLCATVKDRFESPGGSPIAVRMLDRVLYRVYCKTALTRAPDPRGERTQKEGPSLHSTRLKHSTPVSRLTQRADTKTELRVTPARCYSND